MSPRCTRSTRRSSRSSAAPDRSGPDPGRRGDQDPDEDVRDGHDGGMSDDGVTHVPAGEATAAWHQPLVQIIAGTLSGDTTQTSGMTRLEAISGRTVGSEKLW